MRDREILDLYMQICEQKIGVPLEKPTDTAAKKQLEKMIPAGEKVHLFKSQLQKANYEPEGEMVEELDLYDQVLEYLLGEGYSEEESNQIMVSLVNENALSNFLKGVQQRTGIGKPGVGPGQVAKNIVRAGINDVLGTAIGTGSAPGASTPAKAPVAKIQTPPPIVKASTKTPRTAPRGSNISPDPWKGGTTGNRIKDITQKPSAKPTTTRALTGSSGPNVRGALPSSTSSARGGAITPAAKPGSITPAAKPGSITPAAKPTSGKLTNTRIQPVSVREIPSSAKSLGGSNVRGLLPQGARNVLPDPWKQASDTVSGARNLWSRVQQVTKPQSQLKPAQTNVRGMLPAAKPTPTTQSAKPATSTRSQQFRDVQRLNKMTGGGLMGELPSTKPASKPAPKPVSKPADKLPPKPTQSAKPSVKPQKTPTPNTLSTGKQGFSVPGGRLGAFGAGIQAYNTADATLKSAPKLPSTAKEVKKGQTYYDPSTRVGDSQRFAQRKKVGPKIVGPGKVGTEAQSFDKAYGAAKAKSGMGSTFTWKGKSYKVS